MLGYWVGVGRFLAVVMFYYYILNLLSEAANVVLRPPVIFVRAHAFFSEFGVRLREPLRQVSAC